MSGWQASGVWAVPAGVDLARWIDKAACADRPDLPWITDAHRVTARERAAMGVVCARCPVLARCQEAADRLRATAGYWAGAPRDAGVLEPAHEPAPAAAVVWVPHQGKRATAAAGAHVWEQAAISWPDATAGASAVEDGAA